MLIDLNDTQATALFEAIAKARAFSTEGNEKWDDLKVGLEQAIRNGVTETEFARVWGAMPYGASVAVSRFRGQNVKTQLARLWALSEVLRGVGEQGRRTEQKLLDLTRQRDAVREFLGTAQISRNMVTADECDRCNARDGRRIHVGQGPEHGFDGLCDECLSTLAREKA